MVLDVATLSNQQLDDLLGRVRGEMSRRAGFPDAPVCYSISLYAGNREAGAKAWVKEINSIDPSQPNGFGLGGDFVRRIGALPAGTLLVLGGRGGSWKCSTRAYVLVRVTRDASFEFEEGYQEFSGTGVEIVATSGDELDEQAIIDEHADLAPCAGQKLFAIYAALRAAGY
jgi:hypothetical protein